jgi:hypothetical protein
MAGHRSTPPAATGASQDVDNDMFILRPPFPFYSAFGTRLCSTTGGLPQAPLVV